MMGLCQAHGAPRLPYMRKQPPTTSDPQRFSRSCTKG